MGVFIPLIGDILSDFSWLIYSFLGLGLSGAAYFIYTRRADVTGTESYEAEYSSPQDEYVATLIRKMNDKIEAISHTNTISGSLSLAERLEEIIDEVKDLGYYDMYKSQMDMAESVVHNVRDTYYQWRFNEKKKDVEDILASDDPAKIIALQYSTGILNWDDPLGGLTIYHMLANTFGLESDRDAYERIVHMKAQEMLSMEEDMGDSGDPKLDRVIVRSATNPLSVIGGAIIGGALVGSALEVIPGGEYIGAGLNIVDKGATVLFAIDEFDKLKNGDTEGFVRDMILLGAFSLAFSSKFSSADDFAKSKEYQDLVNKIKKYGDTHTLELLDDAIKKGYNVYDLDTVKLMLNTPPTSKDKISSLRGYIKGLSAELEIMLKRAAYKPYAVDKPGADIWYTDLKVSTEAKSSLGSLVKKQAKYWANKKSYVGEIAKTARSAGKKPEIYISNLPKNWERVLLKDSKYIHIAKNAASEKMGEISYKRAYKIIKNLLSEINSYNVQVKGP